MKIHKMINMDMEFVKDESIVSMWETIDFVNNPKQFNPNKKYWKDKLLLDKLSVYADGNLLISFKNNYTKNTKYTKDYIYNLCAENTLCNYEVKEINSEVYMTIEWKSGDYIYGRVISGYYVLKNVKY